MTRATGLCNQAQGLSGLLQPTAAPGRTSTRGLARAGRKATPCTTGSAPPCDYSRPVYNSASFIKFLVYLFIFLLRLGVRANTSSTSGLSTHSLCFLCSAWGKGPGGANREREWWGLTPAARKSRQLSLARCSVLVLQQGLCL